METVPQKEQLEAEFDGQTWRSSEAQLLIERIDALVTLGVPVRVRVEALKRLAELTGPAGKILNKCLAVLEGRSDKKRYWPLMDLTMCDRGIAEQCFPDAP